MGVERAMDAIALELGKDPLDVRLANLYGVAGDTTPYGQVVRDSVALALMRELEADCDYRPRRAAIARWNRDNRWIKRGLALTPVKFGISFTTKHLNQAGALVHVYVDGSIHLNHGGTEMGQGLMIKVAQVVADEFQVPLDTVKISATRTDKVPNTSATAASSGADLNGMAAADACQTIKARLTAFAAAEFSCDPGQWRSPWPGCRVKAEQLMPFVELDAARPIWLTILGSRPLACTTARPTSTMTAPATPATRSTISPMGAAASRGGDRHPDGREQAGAGGYPARCQPLAEPGHSIWARSRRLHPGGRVADHRGTGVRRQGAPRHPFAVHLQDPHRRRPAGRVQRPPLARRREPRADHPPLQGGGQSRR